MIGIAGPTLTLVSDVESALSAVIAAKQKFANLLLAPIIKIDLELEKSGKCFLRTINELSRCSFGNFYELHLGRKLFAFTYAWFVVLSRAIANFANFTASDKFSAAVVSKVPAAFQALAESLTAPIDVVFGYAIGNFTGIL